MSTRAFNLGSTDLIKKASTSLDYVSPKLTTSNDPFGKFMASSNSKALSGLGIAYNTASAMKKYNKYAEKGYKYLNDEKTTNKLNSTIMRNLNPSSMRSTNYHGGKIYKFKKYSKKNRKTKKMCKNRRTRKIQK